MAVPVLYRWKEEGEKGREEERREDRKEGREKQD
jgi:hypothetical protein